MQAERRAGGFGPREATACDKRRTPAHLVHFGHVQT